MTEKFSFTKVSMSYMGYENMNIVQKIKFWIRFPFAFYIYKRCMKYDRDIHEVQK